MILSAEKDVVAGGGEVTVADIPIRDIKEIHCASISSGTQKMLAIKRSLIIGGGIALVVFFAVMIRVGTEDVSKLFSVLLPFSLLSGLVLAFLFSYLPNLSKTKKILLEVRFILNNGKVLSIALEPEQISSARSLLETRGFKLMEADTKMV